MFISSCAAPTLSPPEPCISHRGTPPAPAPDRARCRSGPGRNARSQRRPSTSMTATNGPSPPSPRSSARNVGTLIPVARATLPRVMPRARRAVRRISMSRIVCILGVRKQRMIYIGEGAISSGDRQFWRGADIRYAVKNQTCRQKEDIARVILPFLTVREPRTHVSVRSDRYPFHRHGSRSSTLLIL